MDQYIIISGIVLLIVVGIVFYQVAFLFPKPVMAQPDAGMFVLRNKENGRMLRPEVVKKDDGIPMKTFTARPWTCEVWRFHPLGDGTFIIENVFSGKTFGSDTKCAHNNSQVIQTSVLPDFSLSPIYKFIKLADNSYHIQNTSGHCLTANTPETKKITYLTFSDRKGLNNQKWEVLEAPSRLFGYKVVGDPNYV
jgi:hypothetical protein